MTNKTLTGLLFVPALTIFSAFFLLPLARLAAESVDGPRGMAIYAQIITNHRYFRSLQDTVVISVLVTLASVAVGGAAGLFLGRNVFKGRDFLVALLTLPISFPGVVVGFMIIELAGRQGLIGSLTDNILGTKVVFAYSALGLFTGYLYFSVPRVVATAMATAGKLDQSLEEAARVLGASPWRVLIDVTIPGLLPALISTGAICFATSIGAFGTAFTLATDINVLPIIIYTEFTLSANIVSAAMLSLVLGVVTWLALFLARLVTGTALTGSSA
ncbi:MAG: ABC transporter permease [Deltaproteobacteria bacterium]|jgi:putative spermidine/putrescine transport system permease protein|nr:ABC transporter permease [Deltaproteobacteria bacterium]